MYSRLVCSQNSCPLTTHVLGESKSVLTQTVQCRSQNSNGTPHSHASTQPLTQFQHLKPPHKSWFYIRKISGLHNEQYCVVEICFGVIESIASSEMRCSHIFNKTNKNFNRRFNHFLNCICNIFYVLYLIGMISS